MSTAQAELLMRLIVHADRDFKREHLTDEWCEVWGPDLRAARSLEARGLVELQNPEWNPKSTVARLTPIHRLEQRNCVVLWLGHERRRRLASKPDGNPAGNREVETTPLPEPR